MGYSGTNCAKFWKDISVQRGDTVDSSDSGAAIVPLRIADEVLKTVLDF